MLTTYTKYDEIRAALGVAEEEITDLVLSLPNYEYVLQFDLEDINVELGNPVPGVIDAYMTIKAMPENVPTVNEARFASILQVYAAYVIAKHLLTTIDMFAPQTIKDSKTEMNRVADPYKDTRAGVLSFYLIMRARLIAAFMALFPTVTTAPTATYNPLLAVGLATDPITGA